MIFVTVGTHEQPFNRLIKVIDNLKTDGTIQEEVIMQIGFSTYKPKFCKWSRLLSYPDMNNYMQSSRIIITHGGPASFLVPLQLGKVPIVVPRQKRYGEHVNDHQLDFCMEVEKRMHNIIVVDNEEKIPDVIRHYEKYCNERNPEITNHNKIFNECLDEIVRELVG